MLNVLQRLGHQFFNRLSALGRAGQLLFQSLIAKPAPLMMFPLLVRQLYFVGVLSFPKTPKPQHIKVLCFVIIRSSLGRCKHQSFLSRQVVLAAGSVNATKLITDDSVNAAGLLAAGSVNAAGLLTDLVNAAGSLADSINVGDVEIVFP